MKYFKYTISHSVVGSLILTYAPQEWAADQSFWERSMTYWGVFRSFSTKELSFIKNGATWLKNIFDTYGTEAEVTYQIEAFNSSTYAYDIIYTGILDFSTYKLIDRGRYDVVKIQIIDNSFINTVKTREADDISLAKLFDLDGTAITPFTNEGHSVAVPQRTDNNVASLFLTVDTPTNSVVESVVSEKEDGSILDVSSSNPALLAGAFFSPAYLSALTIDIILSGDVVFSTDDDTVDIQLRRYNSSGVYQNTVSVYTGSLILAGTLSINLNDSATVPVVNPGDYVTLGIYYTGTATSAALSGSMTATYTKLVMTAFNFLAYPYHEAFTRILQAITGNASPFYSTLLGRTDSEITTYAADGEMSLGAVTNGLLIRGFDLNDRDVALTANLRSLFGSLSAVYPLSLGMETIGGVNKIRIEALRHAFDGHYFLTIENCSNITEEVAIDLTFSSLSMGFKKADESYNEMKGRYEFNTNSSYSTPLSRQQNEFSQVSQYRADGNGIVFARAANKAITSSEDTAYDKENFLISLIRSSGLQIKRAEGYSSIVNVENTTDSYNIDYAPARSMRRWGSFLRGSIDKYSTAILSFLKSEKNATMYSQLTTESAPVYEGADVNISALDDPFFENVYYTLDCVVPSLMITVINSIIDSKPAYYFIVRFRANTAEAYKYGWIMKFESRKQDNKGLGQFRLLKVATAYITPTYAGTSYTADNTSVTADDNSITVDNG